MKFIADLHIHSRFSRATSRALTLPALHAAALEKGVTVVGTGDFTHPAWRAELEDQLEPAEPGLYRLVEPLRREAEAAIPRSCRGDVRFLLQVEISTIYKAEGKTRKVHHVILAPSFAEAEALSVALGRLGNVTSDGRPILGLDSRDLLELVLEHCPGGCLIPAHVWTPWFSVLGSKSGFDRVEDCYRDLSEHIFAVETGLSSDPPMNWRVSALDRFTLVSNSDAHSPGKLARECNLFDAPLSFEGMLAALRGGEGGARLLETIEFFPEEGKYHLDGHRKCSVRLTPAETRAHGGRCPECGRPITVGVVHRVDALADRPEGVQPAHANAYRSLVGLAETIGHVLQRGPATKGVMARYTEMISSLGPELHVLEEADLRDVERVAGDLVAEAIGRVRRGEVRWEAGYDGEYGTFEILTPKERSQLTGQLGFFALDGKPAGSAPPPRGETAVAPAPRAPRPTRASSSAAATSRPSSSPTPASPSRFDGAVEQEASQDPADALLKGLDADQRAAVVAPARPPLLVVAGPGTGKTRTLTTRIAHRVLSGGLDARRVLALTFTNRAAVEMAERLDALLGEDAAGLTVTTFHAWGLALLRAAGRARPAILDDRRRRELVARAVEDVAGDRRTRLPRRVADAISLRKSGAPRSLEPNLDDATLDRIARRYDELLEQEDAYDFDDLVLRAVELLEAGGERLPPLPEAVFVDEYQDLNATQVRLLRAVVRPESCELFAIGDPDQAIYGFRGADSGRILGFREDWPGASVRSLGRSYRSTDTILEAASQVIARAPSLGRPRLWSGIDGMPHLLTIVATDEAAEAERIALLVERLLGGTAFLTFDSGLLDGAGDALDLSFADVAVLFRRRRQGEVIAEAFSKLGIPVELAGQGFGDGEPSIDLVVGALRRLAGRGRPSAGEPALDDGGLGRLERLRGRHLDEAGSAGVVERLADEVLHLDPAARATLAPLIGAARRVDRAWTTRRQKTASFVTPGRPIDDLLDWLSLHADLDPGDDRADRVRLLTLHASKGLEWKVVVIAGCEDGILPARLPDGDEPDLDEERRLFFVGMTRAEQLLVLTRAEQRLLWGRRTSAPPSPFLEEIEARYLRRDTAPPPKRRAGRRTTQLELF